MNARVADARSVPAAPLAQALPQWFARRGWQPFPFQQQV